MTCITVRHRRRSTCCLPCGLITKAASKRHGQPQLAKFCLAPTNGDPQKMSDYVKPEALIGSMIESGAAKANLPSVDLLLRGALAGAYLAFVTSMAFLIAAQTGQFIVGALVFPAGFALI